MEEVKFLDVTAKMFNKKMPGNIFKYKVLLFPFEAPSLVIRQ